MNFYDFGLCEGLVQAGAKVTLYTCDETAPPKRAGFECLLTFRRIYGSAPTWVRGLRFTAGLIRSLLHAKWGARASVVHYHFFHFTALEMMCVRLAKLFAFRVVVTVHDVESFSGEFHSSVAKSVARLADLLVCHNDVSRREIEEKLGVPLSKICKIPHGNYLDFVGDVEAKSSCRTKLSLPQEAEIVLFFGQIKKVKGLDLLLSAFARVKKQRPAAMLVIAGKVWKDDADVYTNLVEEFGLSDSVRMDLRYIPDADVAMYYGSADLIALPYRRIYQSGVLLMAMSYGVPVVVSDLPGMQEIVVSGGNGYVFRAGDVEHLSTVLLDALADPAKRVAVAQEASKLMRQDYAWSTIGAKTLCAYGQLACDSGQSQIPSNEMRN